MLGFERFSASGIGLVVVLLLMMWGQVGLFLGTGPAIDQAQPEVDRVRDAALWLVVIGLVAAGATVWGVRRDVVAWPGMAAFGLAGLIGGAFYGLVLYAEDVVTENCPLCLDSQFVLYLWFGMFFAVVGGVYMVLVFFLTDRDRPSATALLAGPAAFQVAAHAAIGVAIMVTIDEVAAYAEEVNTRDTSGVGWLLAILTFVVVALLVVRHRRP